MKIVFQRPARKNITLLLPTRLALNPVTALILSCKTHRKFPPRFFRRLFRAILKERKRLKHDWELVHIHSHTGVQIHIFP